MAAKPDSDAVLTKSIAEAKLERQKKRIEEAEAPLLGKAASRPKGKQWKPFDFTADDSRVSDVHEDPASVSEVRVNTFRPHSPYGSTPRSASLVSHDTPYSETGPWNMTREDSALTEQGFQIYRGRRAGKGTAELGAYEEKPEERQATVEAAFDAREIYEVFGNALPSPEYIRENIGAKNGQIQFIQHPNGDVSAQQWSAERYIWENIGQFSNIRKKVEGQLASDRLKGQTGDQTLQQNTLGYFRTIAKQREASVMGLPFGAKEIQAAMPQPRRNELTATPISVEKASYEPPLLVEHTPLITNATTKKEEPFQPPESSLKPPAQPFLPQSASSIYQASRNDVRRPGQFADYMHYGTIYGQQSRRQDDPFYAASPYQHVYGAGGSSGLPRYYSQHRNTQSLAGPFFGHVERGQTLNYDFNFCPVGQASRHPERVTGTHTVMHGLPAEGKAGIQWQQSTPLQPGGTGHWRDSHMANVIFPNQMAFNNQPHIYGTPANEIAGPQPKPTVPFGSRSSMSDQLWKITETAKERNLSQSNIGRTVLYDPYQNKPAATTTEDNNKSRRSEPQTSGPTFSLNVSGNKLQPPSSSNNTSVNFFPTVLAPQLAKQSPSPGTVPTVSSLLANSAEDPISNTSWEALPQVGEIRTRNGSDDLNSTGGRDSYFEKTKAYETELQEWWTSGNKFARQQDFFESIKAAHRKSTDTTMTSPPAHLTPIGPPSRTPKKQEVASFNETTSRLLIPVLENLASYVQGPPEKRRDYFSQWSQPPEWCIDRSEAGNNSFYDSNWGQPPARVGRDPRYHNRSWDSEQSPRTIRFTPTGGQPGGNGMSIAVGSGIDRRFNFAGR